MNGILKSKFFCLECWVMILVLLGAFILVRPEPVRAEDGNEVVWVAGVVVFLGIAWLCKIWSDERKEKEKAQRMETLRRSYKFASEVSLASYMPIKYSNGKQIRTKVYVEAGYFPIQYEAVRGAVYSLVQRCGGIVVEDPYKANVTLKVYWWKMYGSGSGYDYGSGHSYSSYSYGSSYYGSSASVVEEIESAVAVEIWKAGSLILGPVIAVASSTQVVDSSHSSSRYSSGTYKKSGNYYTDSWQSYTRNWTDREWQYYRDIEYCLSQFK